MNKANTYNPATTDPDHSLEDDEDHFAEFSTKDNSGVDSTAVMEVKYNRFPYCIVWTPLPLISWFLPFIGHTGICTAEGVIHDFAGSYYVSVDDFAFGNPHKYGFEKNNEEL